MLENRKKKPQVYCCGMSLQCTGSQGSQVMKKVLQREAIEIFEAPNALVFQNPVQPLRRQGFRFDEQRDFRQLYPGYRKER
jgi:hypothetical protein